jgi:hypothetical protein
LSSENFFNTLAPELNPSAQRCLPRFLLGILIFKGLTARHIYKSFGIKGLNRYLVLQKNNKLLVARNIGQYVNILPMPVVALFKAWVCGRSQL